MEERSAREVRHIMGSNADNTTEQALREELVAAVQKLDRLGMNRGSTGNASVRLNYSTGDGMLITPIGMASENLRTQDLVWLGFDGTLRGHWQPSSEWHFHRAIYLARTDLNAVVHTHSVNATALACLERGLPAFHYMVAVAGGASVPCVGYHTFGTEALSQAVAEALRDRQACLMAHHGLVAAGESTARAMKIAIEIESLCETYLKALAVNEPVLLSAAQMSEVIDKFKTYGKSKPS